MAGPFKLDVMRKIIVLKTNISNIQMLLRIASALNALTGIKKWTIDIEDIDNVLRVECSDELQEKDIKKLIQLKGFTADALPD
jgi:hypothetical protein